MLNRMSALFRPSISGAILFLASINLLINPANGQERHQEHGEEILLDSQFTSRNENSTPRTSILPISPAILDFHSSTDAGEDGEAILRSKALLMRLGYEIGRVDKRITAKFKAAIFKYQQGHNIPPTGILNKATLQKLRGVSP